MLRRHIFKKKELKVKDKKKEEVKTKEKSKKKEESKTKEKNSEQKTPLNKEINNKTKDSANINKNIISKMKSAKTKMDFLILICIVFYINLLN